jgi:uncharacterized membrane protein YedE/YeeE
MAADETQSIPLIRGESGLVIQEPFFIYSEATEVHGLLFFKNWMPNFEGGARMRFWTPKLLVVLVILLMTAAAWIGQHQAEAGDSTAKAAVSAIGDSEAQPMMDRSRWSPYLVGIGLGILSWISFLLIDSGLGASSAYARTGALMEGAVRRGEVPDRDYYAEHLRPLVNPGLMMAGGIVVGAFISAQLSGDFQFRAVPALWAVKYGPAPSLRFVAAFIGGAIMAIGARWAGGCTSGHGITGTMQLALSSWIALVCFFVGGVCTAMLLYRM